MVNRKSGYMVYIGETKSRNRVLESTLYKNEIYWIEFFGVGNVLTYFIYNKYCKGDIGYDYYIGCSDDYKNIVNDFISLAEYREKQIKSVLDD